MEGASHLVLPFLSFPPSSWDSGDLGYSFPLTVTMQFCLLAATLLAGCVTAAKSIGEYQVFEKVSAAPAPWVRKDGFVDPEQSFKLRIHLKNRNVESFQQQVIDISTPDHPSYGRHMSKFEIRDMLSPAKQSFDAVMEWIEAQGLSEVSKVEDDWVIVESTLGDVEELLQTEYHYYINSDSGKNTARTLQYSLPAGLHGHVDIVAPTIKFPTTKAHRSTIVKDMTIPSAQFGALVSTPHDGLNATACNTTITPDCLKALYKFEHFRASRRNGNQIALAGFLEEYAQHDDLQTFLKAYDAEAVGYDFSEILINKGLNTQQNTTNMTISMGEANLDMQYGLSLVGSAAQMNGKYTDKSRPTQLQQSTSPPVAVLRRQHHMRTTTSLTWSF